MLGCSSGHAMWPVEVGIMPGPDPKHPSTRARRNKTATAATLRADHAIQAPELPGDEWHPLTLAWWRDIWASPMAPEYDDSDRHGLFVLAQLVEDFWRAETVTQRKDLAAELRQQGQRFGLSPIDRRRLQWEIERSEEAQEKGTKRRANSAGAKNPAAGDPRAVFRVV
jgi:hypothetical protein